MKDIDVPAFFTIPFANSAPGSNKTYPIPAAAQPLGRASLTEGFGPINSTPVAAGGIPPFGADENGILFWLSSQDRWEQAGGPAKYDATFQTAIGGYPKGAIVASTTTDGVVYRCTGNDNTSNPDTNGAGWTSLLVPRGKLIRIVAGTTSLTVPVGITQIFVPDCFAGGGGGGGALNNGDLGGGAAGGEWRSGWINVVPGETLTIVVGAGGIGGTPGNNGSNGTDTTITGSVSGLLIRCKAGGFGGGSNGSLGPFGVPTGVGTGGDESQAGDLGGTGFVVPGNGAIMGAGGPAFKGFWHQGLVPAGTAQTGGQGQNFGNGGGGGVHAGAGPVSGGNGHDGKVVMQWGNYGTPVGF